MLLIKVGENARLSPQCAILIFGRGGMLKGFLVFTILILGSAAYATDQPAISLHIQCVQVSDDDGSRRARVTPEQFKQWVDFGNRVYAPAGIRFAFSRSNGDFGLVKSTLLNNMTGTQDSKWDDERRLGNRIAARFPDKVTVFCRFGPGNQGTGGAFGSWDYKFVVMGGFDDMSHCGHPHYDALAHEIGHYLGISHTFPVDPFPDEASAEAYLKQHDNKPACFDGDGLPDTLPDPSIRPMECDRRQSVILNGVTFELPRRNLMSYYDERDTLSPEQIKRVRLVLHRRMSNGMGRPSNVAVKSPIEAESLEVVDKHECSESVQDMSSWGGADVWSGGKQLFCASAENGSITLLLQIKKQTHTQLSVYLTQSWDFGKIQAYLDDKTLGDVFDAYSPFVMASGCVPLATLDLSAGDHHLRFDVVGKNEDSTGYRFGIDCLEIRSVGSEPGVAAH